MSTSSRVVFFGNERLVSGLAESKTPILRGLIEHGYDVAAVVVNHTDAQSRSARPLEVAALAAEHNIPVLSPAKTVDILDHLIELDADCAILAAYGRIIPQRVLDVFSPIGIINIHPSLLPRHRGSTPIESTIIHGDSRAGVSIMQLTAGMDEGPVYAQLSLELDGTESKFELHDQLTTSAADLLFELLPGILDGSIQPKPQSDDGVSYTTMISKQDGSLDPTTDTATQLERNIRAYQGFPKPKITIRDSVVIVTAATVAPQTDDKGFFIACRDQTYLRIDELIAPNGKKMSGDAYLRGLR